MKHVGQQPVDKHRKQLHKGIFERISHPITILCAVVLALSGVFAFFLNQQHQLSEERLRKATEDLTASQQEVAKLKAALESKPVPNSQQPPPDEFQVSAEKDQTVGAAELRITPISLIQKTDPPPPKYVVTARVQYKDLPELQIRDAAVGAKVTYPKEHGFTIRVVKVDANSASFAFSKNP